MNRRLTALTLSLLTLGAIGMSRDALACGGTFCDSGPAATPVDQTGENVLFVLDGNTVEAHVQIQYVGGASRFAWIVPMPKIPEVSVGSQLLFNALLQGTVPTYGYTQQFDQCGAQTGAGGSLGIGPFNGGSAGTAGTGSAGGPTVVVDKVVGSFEVVVLQGGTAQEVSDWLQSNGYQTVPNAAPLLQKYVDKSYVFAAIKLTAGTDVTEIHPLVFKYAGNEPCVPLQLTAVAAQPDMGVRAFFLGDDRVFPSNYAHVMLNPVRVDWRNSANNYDSVVSRAVDSPGSDGHGFVTEYAGVSSVVSSSAVYSTSWNAGPFRTATAEQVITLLNQQGLVNCSSYQAYCVFNHPLLLPLLEQFLPLPSGTSPTAYSCLGCDVDAGGCFGCDGAQIDLSQWDGNAFADALQTRVIDPGLHAQQLLQKWTYLTRLFTTISPDEMTLDPTFEARPERDYDFVSMTSSFGKLRTTCCGQQAMILPAQGSAVPREVALNGSAWPPFSSLMPWAETIEQVPLLGDIMTVVDNSKAIDTELARWNSSQMWPPASSAGACSNGMGIGAGGAGTGTGMFPRGGASGTGNTADGGCACSLPRRPNALGLAGALGLLGFGLLRRRRRG
jgi:hypothetical protein